MSTLNFGDALVALKAGRRVAREGWNGKGMWLEHYKPQHAVDLPYIRMSYPVGGKAYPQGARVPWLASQTDMLAEDWVDLDAVTHKVYTWADVERYELANDWTTDRLKYRVTMKDDAKFTGAVNTHDMAHQDRPAVARAIVDDINRQVREAHEAA